MRKLYKNIVGQKYNRLTVIEFIESIGNKRYWLCRCECGNTSRVETYALTSGKIKSCGCYAREFNGKAGITHGLSNKTIYNTWKTMLHRCENRTDKRYNNYGGRGITVCEEWHDIVKFYNWAVDNGYKEGLSIDRINGNGNYEPSNCRWATREEQANNLKSNKKYTVNGRTESIKTWGKISGIPECVISSRIRRGWDVEEAVTLKVNKTRKYIHGKAV